MNKEFKTTAFIDGQEVDEMALMRKELERARVALALLKKKLGEEKIEELLRDDMAEMDQKLARAAQENGGELVVSQATLKVQGMKAAEFFKAFRTFTPEINLSVMPEHYLIHDDENGRHIIETCGCWDKPVDLRGRFQPNDDNAPAQIKAVRDKDFPILNYIACPLNLHPEVAISAYHQFRDTDDGIEVRLAVFYPKGIDQEMLDGHKWHLAIEWSNWARKAYNMINGINE